MDGTLEEKSKVYSRGNGYSGFVELISCHFLLVTTALDTLNSCLYSRSLFPPDLGSSDQTIGSQEEMCCVAKEAFPSCSKTISSLKLYPQRKRQTSKLV